MADGVKQYIVDYVIDSSGNAATSFKNLSEQAANAQASVDSLRKNIEVISRGIRMLSHNEALKNIWNIKPTVNIDEAKAQFKVLEQEARASAQRIQGYMSKALAGNKLGGIVSKGELEKLKKERDEALKKFNQVAPGVDPDKKGYRGRLSKDAREARKLYRDLSKTIAAQEALNKDMQPPHAVTTVNNLANQSKNIGNAAKAINNLKNALQKFNTLNGAHEITISADISPALRQLNNLVRTINTATAALPVRVTDSKVTSANKAIGKDGKLTKAGQAAVNAAEKATIGVTSQSKATAIAQKQTIDKLRAQIEALNKQLQTAANKAPIVLKTKLLEDGTTGYQLSLHIGKLQQAANAHPILLKASITSSNINSAIQQASKGKGTATGAKPIDLKVNLVPGAIAGQIQKITSEARKVASAQKPINLKVGVQKGAIARQLSQIISESQKLAPARRGVNLNVKLKLNTATLTADLNRALTQLQAEADKRAISVRSTLNGNNLIAQLNSTIASLEKAIAKFSSMRVSQSTTGTRQGAITNGTRNRGNTYIAPGTGTRQRPISASTRALQSGPDYYSRFRAWAYPYTGNTSFGARTPMMVDMAKGMGTMFAIGGAMSAVGSSVSQAVQYQNQMRTTKAILENGTETYTPQGFVNMEHTVREVGRKTKFTAPDVANAARFMAMAGLDTNDINNAIRPIADIALIGDTDLGATADKLTNVMTTFNIPASKMRDVADIMTSTFTRTNTDMMMLAESTKYAGGIANLYGGNFKNNFADVMAMFGVLGNAGIQASSAGTTIRMMYQNLMQPNKNQYKTLQKFGIVTRDKNGQPLEMADIIHQIHDKVPQNQLADAVGSMFRITAQPGAAALASHIDTLDRIIQANRAAAGTNISGQIAGEKQNTIAGLWAQVTSTFTEGVVKAFENREGGWAKMLGDLRDYLASPETVKTISKIIDLVENLAKTMAWFADIWAKAYSKFPNLINGWLHLQLAFTQIGYLITPIVSLIGVFSSLRGVIAALTGTAARASVVMGGPRMGHIVGGAYQAANIATGGARYTEASIAGNAAYQAARDKKLRYEVMRNRLRNSVNYHGQRVDVSPLWYGTMAQFGINAAESNRWMNERSKFASTDIVERQAAARRANAGIMRQQAIMNEQLRAMRRPEQLMNGALMMRYATMYGGREGANQNWVAQGNAVAAQRAAAFETRRAEQLANKELLKRYYMMNGSRGALGLGMKGAFQRGINMGTLGLTAAGLFGGIKSAFYSLMTSLSKAVGLLVSPVGLAVAGLALLGGAIYKVYNDAKKYKEAVATAEKNSTWATDANKKLQDAYLNGSIAAGGFKPVEVGYKKAIDDSVEKSYSLSDNKVVDDLLNNTKPLTGSDIVKQYTKNSDIYLPHDEITDYYRYNKDYRTHQQWDKYTADYVEVRNGINKEAQNAARKLGVIAQWGKIASEQDDVTQAIQDLQKALYGGDQKHVREILAAYRPTSVLRMNNMGSAQAISEITDPTKYYEWQYAQYQVLQNMLSNYTGPAQYRQLAYGQIKDYQSLNKNQRANFDGLKLAQNLVQGWAVRFNGTVAAITLNKMGQIDWIALANSVNNGIPFTIEQQEEILKGTYDAIYNDPNIKNLQSVIELLNHYLPEIANQQSPYAVDAEDIVGGFSNYMSTPLYSPAINANNANDTSWMTNSWFNTPTVPKIGFEKAINDTGGSLLMGTALYQQRRPDLFSNSNNSTTKPLNLQGSTYGRNRAPQSNRSTTNQKDYANTYGRGMSRPTQVIINIENLARFDRTAIAKNAEEKDIIAQMEGKITEAIMMLASTALNESGSLIAQGNA